LGEQEAAGSNVRGTALVQAGVPGRHRLGPHQAAQDPRCAWTRVRVPLPGARARARAAPWPWQQHQALCAARAWPPAAWCARYRQLRRRALQQRRERPSAAPPGCCRCASTPTPHAPHAHPLVSAEPYSMHTGFNPSKSGYIQQVMMGASAYMRPQMSARGPWGLSLCGDASRRKQIRAPCSAVCRHAPGACRRSRRVVCRAAPRGLRAYPQQL
jgi:hypothetical protein